MNCLYNVVHDSFCWPNVVPVTAFSAFSFLLALLIVAVTCGVNVRCGSKVTPRIFGFLSRGSTSLNSVTVGCLWCSCLSGVSSVIEDLDGATDMRFSVSHVSSECR